MKVIQVAAGLDEPGAGPSYSVARLSVELESLGAEVEMHCVLGWRASPSQNLRPVPYRHRQDLRLVPGLKSLCLSNDLHVALGHAAPRVDVIHAHGLWLMPNVYPSWVAKRSGTPLVLSPRGMLGSAALKFSSRRKAMFWRFLQHQAVAAVGCLHATSEAEYDEIRAFGLTNPVAIIPNGVDLPSPGVQSKPTAVRTVLTLGRIHPKKGLSNLVRAWAALEAQHPDWRLNIVGPDEVGHANELASLGRELGLQHLTISGPVFGAEKLAKLRAADLFVLPTLNENFALTVAEALAAGTPVIATKGAPWAELETNRCGWWVDIGVEPLAKALAKAMILPRAELDRMGTSGRAWVSDAFSWARVANDMLGVYGWLANEGAAPSFVRID